MSDTTVALKSHPRGATLAVRAQPGAKKSAVLGVHAGALKLAVTAPAQDGRANAALLELLHSVFQVKRSDIELLSGATSRNKVFLFVGQSCDQLVCRLQAFLSPSTREGTGGNDPSTR